MVGRVGCLGRLPRRKDRGQLSASLGAGVVSCATVPGVFTNDALASFDCHRACEHHWRCLVLCASTGRWRPVVRAHKSGVDSGYPCLTDRSQKERSSVVFIQGNFRGLPSHCPRGCGDELGRSSASRHQACEYSLFWREPLPGRHRAFG